MERLTANEDILDRSTRQNGSQDDPVLERGGHVLEAVDPDLRARLLRDPAEVTRACEGLRFSSWMLRADLTPEDQRVFAAGWLRVVELPEDGGKQPIADVGEPLWSESRLNNEWIGVGGGADLDGDDHEDLAVLLSGLDGTDGSIELIPGPIAEGGVIETLRSGQITDTSSEHSFRAVTLAEVDGDEPAEVVFVSQVVAMRRYTASESIRLEPRSDGPRPHCRHHSTHREAKCIMPIST